MVWRSVEDRAFVEASSSRFSVQQSDKTSCFRVEYEPLFRRVFKSKTQIVESIDANVSDCLCN